ncbi:LysR substrate-binding domain-containing protein [Aquimarina sp. D1M17]|uniref:hydrogen peroxide-inducible genes activator n=1 Tax=Aquimarina acroporae TaxID=2937283 RepID=UPI0020BDDC57|nr:hydrogen peroxide-inducible genes activator [Aquimarina acroporae]MCK8523070.1 LysR substrate-binding domain-containing protein [Aquimarina acroporae]
MNIQQYQYVLAVVNSKNFELAAEKCFVTQSTLSTMINKFENEIGIKIFNRKTKPVTVTKEGEKIIERLQIIVNEIDLLTNVIQEIKGEMIGSLKIGIIPTLAPYLLPLFITDFVENFPKVNISVRELNTSQIQDQLLKRNLDIGILALPLKHKELTEYPLFEEPFLIYDCTEENTKSKVSPPDLKFSKMCLLEEGHCLRTQVYDICELSAKYMKTPSNFKFESGSMESLLRITESRKGITILPYLANRLLNHNEKSRINEFKDPVPVRSIGLVTHNFFVKKVLSEELARLIQTSVTDLIPKTEQFKIVNPV